MISGSFASFLESRLDASYSVAIVFSFVVLVITGIVLSRVLAVSIGKVVKMTILRFVDRFTGALLGLLLGMVVGSLLVTLTLELPLDRDFQKKVARSSMGLFLRPIAGQMFDWVAHHGAKSKSFEEFFRNSNKV